ncbi:MAG: hypothetical protein N5P05_004377 (plasmid) [Chroococcopsis gigantea SAG 12.99]|jgi:putative DNA primase/helicase|nr:hypothetical protein [Chroococcopsis gigantea SAG 12.99]
MLTRSTPLTWSEAKKANPCPLCQKPDWCFIADNGEVVLCRRIDRGSQPGDWKYIKDSADGFPIFALDKGQGWLSPPFKLRKESVSKKTSVQRTLPSQQIRLATLADYPDSPETTHIEQTWGYDIEISYAYSDTQIVKRTEHCDHNGQPVKVNGKEKIILPYHRNEQGEWVNKKGSSPWLPYKLDEAIAQGQDKWVLGVEGEKCVEAARSVHLVAVTWQGGSWTDEEITEGLGRLKAAGVSGLVYWPDNDEPGLRKAEKILKAGFAISFPVLLLNPLDIWQEIPDKGDIADWVNQGQTQNMMKDDYIARLEAAIHSAVAQRHNEPVPDDSDEPVIGQKPPKPDIIAASISENYRDKWIYCDEIKSWMEYEHSTKGVWHPVSELYASTQIHHVLKAHFITGYGESYLNNVVGILKRELYVSKWSTDKNLLPFSDRVLKLSTGRTREHHPTNRLTWVLPRPYISPEVSWKGIDTWLGEATQGSERAKRTLLCFAAAVLRRRYDLQKFVHLIGTGGSGKSTFMNLLIALVGEGNTVSIDLESLNERDALADMFGKVLAVFPDQDSGAGKKLSNFKKLTGGDLLRGRRLYQDGFNFRFEGMSLVTSNNPIFHGATAKWLTRRAVVVPFSLSVPTSKIRNLEREFQPELSALTAYLLSIPEAEIEATLSGQTINSTLWESQVRSDGLASWLNDWVILDPTGKAAIGSDRDDWSHGGYNPNISTLFGSYCLHCKQSNRQPLTKDNFSANLLELLQTLNWQADKVRTNAGRFIRGIRLRTAYDDGILPLDEMLSSHPIDGDGIGDGVGVDISADFKPLPDKDCAERDDLSSNFVESEQLPPRLETHIEEQPQQIADMFEIAIDIDGASPENNSSLDSDEKEEKEVERVADTPTQTESEEGIEVSTVADTGAVTEVSTADTVLIGENPRLLVEVATDEILIFLGIAAPGFYLVLDERNGVRRISQVDCVDVTGLGGEGTSE